MTDAERDAEDPDRRAILARRQRFIALALAGLGGGAACAARQEHSERPDQAEREGDTEGEPQPSSDGVDPIDMPPPRPRKELPRKRRRWTAPQSCLRVHLPDEEAP